MLRSFAVVWIVLGVLGCASSESTNAPANATPSEGSQVDTPVTSRALEGNVGGKPFTGRVALANLGGKTGVANIFIFDRDRTCADYADANKEGWAVTVVVRWQSGISGKIGGLSILNGEPVGTSGADLIQVTFRDRPTGDAERKSATARQGRVEVIDASSERGSVGRLRLRASSEEGYQVEGEIKVEICTIYPDQ